MILRGEGEQVRIAEALADRSGLGRDGDRGLEIAGRHVLEHERQQQVAPFRAVTVLALDEPPGTPEPARRAARLAPQDEVDRDPERARAARSPAPRIQVRAIRTLHGAQVVRVAAQHVGRRRQQLEILGCQRHRPIGV